MYKLSEEWKLFTGNPDAGMVRALLPGRSVLKAMQKEGTMKKKIWSLLLCFMLVCTGFIGCGSKDDTAANAAPEEMVRVRLTEFVDAVSDALSKADMEKVSLENVGWDFTLDLSLEEQLATNYGLTGLESLGLTANVDVKEGGSLHAAGNVLLNGENVIAADAVTDQEKIYVNVPAYSKQYMGISYEEILGKSLKDYMNETAKANEGLPSSKDLLAMWKSFSAKFIDSFVYQGKEEKQEIGTGDYKLTGEKYITTAKAEDIDASFSLLMEELKKFPKVNVQQFSSLSENMDTLYVNYYVGKKDQYAWEFQGVKTDNKTMSIVVVSTKKGFSFYVVDEDGKEETLVYSEKESDKKGKIMICDKEQEIVIEYDNYTKDSVDLSTTIDGMALKLKLRSVDENLSVDFDVNVLGIVVSGEFKCTEGEVNLTASLSMSGMKMGSVKLNARSRDFVSYTVPESSLSKEEWSEGFDQEKMVGDLSQLMMKFPFLMDLME